MKRALLALLWLVACATNPEPIRWGLDTCDQCRMILSDRRFGAEWVASPRTYKFDGLDELGRWRRAHPSSRGRAFVVAGDSGELIPSGNAVYLVSPTLRAPMGGHVMSFPDRPGALRYAADRHLRSIRFVSFDEAQDHAR